MLLSPMISAMFFWSENLNCGFPVQMDLNGPAVEEVERGRFGRKSMGTWGDFTLLMGMITPVRTGMGPALHTLHAMVRNTQPYTRD